MIAHRKLEDFRRWASLSLLVAALSVGGGESWSQPTGPAAEIEWALGRWTGYSYGAGSRSAMNAREVAVVISRRPSGGGIVCQMAYVEDIARARPLGRCSVSADRVFLTTSNGYEFEFRRDGKTLKGKGTHPTGNAEVELTRRP